MVKAPAAKAFLRDNYLALLLALIPFLYLLSFLAKYSVNTPFYDQWELVPILQHVNNGHYTFYDFWRQHNEHRLFFPRLLMVAEAKLTHWDTQIEIFTNAALALFAFGLFITSLRVAFKNEAQKLPLGLIILTALIWFSPLQQENWLWGWQLQWFLNVLGVMVVIYGLTRTARDNLTKLNAGLLISGAILAEFSLGNGVLLWPIIIAALLYLKIPRRQIGVMAAIGTVMIVVYYIGYQNPAGPAKSLALHQPIKFVQYFFSYLGRPLIDLHYITPIFGMLILLTFGTISIYSFWRHKTFFRQITPFLGLGLYAIGSAIITSLSRLGFGIAQAFSSRYTTISSLLLISTAVITIYFIRYIFNTSTKWRHIQLLLILGTGFLVIFNGHAMLAQVHNQAQYRRDIKTCTHAVHPNRVCLESTYPNIKIVSPRLQYLKDIHWGGY